VVNFDVTVWLRNGIDLSTEAGINRRVR